MILLCYIRMIVLLWFVCIIYLCIKFLFKFSVWVLRYMKLGFIVIIGLNDVVLRFVLVGGFNCEVYNRFC